MEQQDLELQLSILKSGSMEVFSSTQGYIKSYLASVKHGFLEIDADEIVYKIEELLDSQRRCRIKIHLRI